jgi:hypothetical protein
MLACSSVDSQACTATLEYVGGWQLWGAVDSDGAMGRSGCEPRVAFEKTDLDELRRYLGMI